MRRAFVVSCLVSLVAYACSDSEKSNTPLTEAPPASTGTSPGTGTAPPAPTSTGRKQGLVIGTSPLLINELSGGGEWVELVNTGSDTADLGGWKIADSKKASDEPKMSEAATFPPGTKLAPMEYAIVKGGGLDGGGKPCPDGGQIHCLNAEFGISKKDGDAIYLLGPDGGAFGLVPLPANATPASGFAWCRIPSADPKGQFQSCPETPGAANAAQ